MKRQAAPRRGRSVPLTAGIRLLPLVLCALLSATARGESPPDLRDTETIRPDGIHVLDGSYVLNMGALHINITNHGLIGSQYTQRLPYSSAPSGQWPGGSGNEYLWGAGLWIGGKVAGEPSVTTGQPVRELRPGDSIFDTIYEARGGRVIRPTLAAKISGRRLPDPGFDDDHDGQRNEDFLNGWDDDGDGLVDEDFGQIASQMFTCTMHDWLPLVRELYPDHLPLGVSVIQRAAAFEQVDYEDIIVLDYEITNAGHKQVTDLFLGMYVDCDIQSRKDGSSNPDDLAGFFSGAVRGPDGTFHRLEVAWMKDADPVDPLPGVFGTILLGHDTDPLAYYAPKAVGVHGFQIFATNALGIQGGEPHSDPERYQLMARKQIDRDRRTDQPGDLKFMISSGPFGDLPPGRKIKYQVAMVVGDGMGGMLQNALKASVVHRGRYFDLDDDANSGYSGRETKLCIGDYPVYRNGKDRLFGYRFMAMNLDCVGELPAGNLGFEVIAKTNMFQDDDGRLCIYVNADNCEECFRVTGRECTQENRLFWLTQYSQYKTGRYGRETNVPWVFPGLEPPQPPHARVVPGDNAVDIFWDDISEYSVDPTFGVRDFESYRVYRVAGWVRPDGTTEESGPESVLWGAIAEFDLVNTIPAGIAGSNNERTLGRNTGLEPAAYVPACLSDPRFEGLAAAMQQFVDADVAAEFTFRPPLRNRNGGVISGREMLVPWEFAPAVLDTFFDVTSRVGSLPPNRVVAKRGLNYYHFRDTKVHNGFQTYYAVVATDHTLEWDGTNWQPAGYGTQSDPANNQHFTTPAPVAQTVAERRRDGLNIYAYPNPATREALAEFQKQPGSDTSPTGARIMFNNLPAAHNTIKIFTASGDLVQTLYHDGLQDGGAVAWDLMSRNRQEVTSGIYLYAVESDNSAFEPFRGRFAVIR